MAVAVLLRLRGAISTPRCRARTSSTSRRALRPVTTYVMHRDEQGRTRTNIWYKALLSHGGTEVSPRIHSTGHVHRQLLPQSIEASCRKTSRPRRPIPYPFFLPADQPVLQLSPR